MSNEVETSLIISPASPTPSSVRQHSRLGPVSMPDRQFSSRGFDRSPPQRAQRTSLPPPNLSADSARAQADNQLAWLVAGRRQDRHERCLLPPLDTYHLA